MKKRNPSDWREARRLQAWILKEKGWQQSMIAEALGVTKGAVSQWVKRAQTGGVEALHSRKGGGPKPRLSNEQLRQLSTLLSKGTAQYGFRDGVWTRPRVAQVIKHEFGVTFTPQHVGNLLRKIGWGGQRTGQSAG